MKRFAPIYTEEFVSIAVDKENHSILVSWKKKCSSKEYRNTLIHALEIAQDLQLNSWISDLTEETAISIEDEQWLTNDFMPKAKNNFVKVAFVLNDEVLCNSRIVNLHTKLKDCPSASAYFSTLQEAQHWLLN